jgi:hypothetical protein
MPSSIDINLLIYSKVSVDRVIPYFTRISTVRFMVLIHLRVGFRTGKSNHVARGVQDAGSVKTGLGLCRIV